MRKWIRHNMTEELHKLAHRIWDLQLKSRVVLFFTIKRDLREIVNLLDEILDHATAEEMHKETIRKMIEKGGTTLTDILQVTAMFTCLILGFLLAGLWWWVYFWAILLAVFGIFEGLSYWRTHKTLSQQFGAFRRKYKTYAIGITILLLLGWGIFIWHLWS